MILKKHSIYLKIAIIQKYIYSFIIENYNFRFIKESYTRFRWGYDRLIDFTIIERCII